MPNSDWAGRRVLASIVNRSYFLIGDLLLGDDIPQDLKCAGPDVKKNNACLFVGPLARP